MQEFITLYSQHRTEVEQFLIETLRHNGHLLSDDEKVLQKYFGILPSLELVYITNSEYEQLSGNVYRDRIVFESKGAARDYLLSKVKQREEDFFISQPYISSATGESCITVMLIRDEQYVFFDFNLLRLLTRFGLVERHPAFNLVTKSFYLMIGVSLMFFSLMSIGYAFYDYFLQWLAPEPYTLESVFKPIVSLTMGLAIFDLAKTLMEREVFFKAYSNQKDEFRLLSKFLIAIIIALSIEALMVVFKIALNDPTQMLHALYLIIGVALIILSLALYSRWKTPSKSSYGNEFDPFSEVDRK